MKQWDFDKKEYQDIEIPSELHKMVQQTIEYDRRKRAARNRMRIIRTVGSVAAVFFAVFAVGVNSSYAFAKTAGQIPVFGQVAKALIVRDYSVEKASDQDVQESLAASDSLSNRNQIATKVTENALLMKSSDADSTVSDNSPVNKEDMSKWVSSITIDQLNSITEQYTPNMDTTYASQPEKLKTILLASDQTNQVYLYGFHANGSMEGVILRMGNSIQYFDWIYMTDEKKLPLLSCADYNKDNKKEVSILLYNRKTENNQIVNKISENNAPVNTTEVSGNNPITDNSESAVSTASVAAGVSMASTAGIESADSAVGSDQNTGSVSGNDSSSYENQVVLQSGILGKEELWIAEKTQDNTISAVSPLTDAFSKILQNFSVFQSTKDNSIQLSYNGNVLEKYVLGNQQGAFVCVADNQIEISNINGIHISFQIGLKKNASSTDYSAFPGLTAELDYDGTTYNLQNVKTE